MPLMVPLHSIILSRGSRRVIPDVGKAFEFTDDEAAGLSSTAARPATGADPVGGFQFAISGSSVVSATRRRQEREAEAIGKGVAKALAEHGEAVLAAAKKGEPPPAEPKPATPKRAAKPAAEDEDL